MPAGIVRRLAVSVLTTACVLGVQPASAVAQAEDCDQACHDAAAAARLASINGIITIEATAKDAGDHGDDVAPKGGPSKEEAAAVVGGGGGAASACAWRPLGPIAQVAAAQAAINAGQMPTVGDPSTDGALALVPSVINIVGGNTDWYRVTGTSAQVHQEQVCNGVRTGLGWFDLVPDGAGGLVVQVSAEDLVPGAYAQVVRQLPTPVPRIGPADEDDDGYAFVNTPAIFWLDEAPGQWAPVTGGASAGGISVTVQATPVELVVDPGDGAEPVRCGQFRPVLRADAAPGREFPPDGSCSYRYRDSSAMAPNGATWPVTVSIVWHATWSATTGLGGDLGFVETTSPVRDLPVAESQAVIVDSHPD